MVNERTDGIAALFPPVADQSSSAFAPRYVPRDAAAHRYLKFIEMMHDIVMLVAGMSAASDSGKINRGLLIWIR